MLPKYPKVQAIVQRLDRKIVKGKVVRIKVFSILRRFLKQKPIDPEEEAKPLYQPNFAQRRKRRAAEHRVMVAKVNQSMTKQYSRVDPERWKAEMLGEADEEREAQKRGNVK